MQERPEPTPEGRLIEEAADRLDLSIREAARRANLSYGRWRQIVKGFQNVSPGVYAPVRGVPAKTIARMAKVVGVTPEQLAEAGRADAAALLEADMPRPAPLPEPVSLVEVREARLRKGMLDATLADPVEQVLARVRSYPDGTPGHVIFPHDQIAAELWDMEGLRPDDRLALLALYYTNQADRRAARYA